MIEMFSQAINVFSYKSYRNFWVSNLASNSAIWMQNMACAIIITQLSTSPFTNALVQVAATLPLFLFGLFAGIAGDHFNKYKVLTLAQLGLSFISLLLCLLTFRGLLNPWIFILMTFLFSTATTFRMPSAQAGIAATVPENKIRLAAIMNNLSFNICRTLGPAIAGLLLLFLPVYGIFLLSSILLGIVAINFFRQSKKVIIPVVEKIAYKKCIKQITADPLFRDCGIDAFLIFFSGSLIWALMPYLAKYELHQNAGGQGLLMAIIGCGALLTVVVLPPLVATITRQSLLKICYTLCLIAFVLILLASHHSHVIVAIALALFGLGWSLSVASINGLIQSHFTKSIATRAIALYLMIMYFSQFTGSLWAGFLSNIFSVNTAMYSSIILLVIGFIRKLKGVKI